MIFEAVAAENGAGASVLVTPVEKENGADALAVLP